MSVFLAKGKTKNSVRTGWLCHCCSLIFSIRNGGGCYEKIHIKNYIFNCCVFNSTYTKSKIAPTGQVRAI